MAHQQAKLTSIEPRSTTWLSEVIWHDINEPGAYVEAGVEICIDSLKKH